MKKLLSVTFISAATSTLLPQFAFAVSYNTDGAVILGDKQAVASNNILAAAGLGQFDFTTLILLGLIFASLFLFHAIWHPKRAHDSINDDHRRHGSIKFYLGGMIVWMLITVMAEHWELLLPLAVLFAGSLVYYLLEKSKLLPTEKSLQ